jgi:hypothetical protein
MYEKVPKSLKQLFITKLLRFMRFPIEDGIVPEKSDSSIIRLFKLVRLPIVDGIGPLKLQREISKLVKPSRLPNRTGPVKLQSMSVRLLKLLSLATEDVDA